MPSINISPGLDIATVGILNPVSVAAGAFATGWIKADKFAKYHATLLTGVLGTAATVDAKIEQASAADGTGAKDVTGKTITQLVKASHDNKQVEISLVPSELDLANAFYWFRVSGTVGAAASILGGLVQGITPKYGPASDHDLASVVQKIL
jgi:hypothetical protein